MRRATARKMAISAMVMNSSAASAASDGNQAIGLPQTCQHSSGSTSNAAIGAPMASTYAAMTKRRSKALVVRPVG